MNDFIICSYYTRDSEYETMAKRLANSLDLLKLKYYIEPINNRGNWVENIHYKNEFILNVFEKFPGKSVVFIDADSEVKKYPSLFNEIDAHLAMISWRGEFYSSTIYLLPDDRIKKILKLCLKRHLDYPEERHQVGLQTAWREFGGGLKFFKLPLSYSYMEHYFLPEIVGQQNIVIQHFQLYGNRNGTKLKI